MSPLIKGNPALFWAVTGVPSLGTLPVPPRPRLRTGRVPQLRTAEPPHAGEGMRDPGGDKAQTSLGRKGLGGQAGSAGFRDDGGVVAARGVQDQPCVHPKILVG